MKKQTFVLIILTLIGIALSSLTTPVAAGNTGKIKGTVVDAQTGQPIIGANVYLENTTQGAASDMKGEFIILNVPPGSYILVARVIGYKIYRVDNLRVSIDLTTTYDFRMEPTVIEAEAVQVVAERPMVVKDLTATTAVMQSDEISALPITEVNEAIELQAGLVKDAGGGLHIRGGRSGEVSYWIDGIPVTDAYNGGTVVDVNKDMVQELQVVSGAFNAEYGQAMSGIVNITTKEGSNNFGGTLTVYGGDYASFGLTDFKVHDKEFMNIGNINPLAIRNIEGSLNGALLKDKLFFYMNGRYNYSDGWLYGQRLYNPNAVTVSLTEVPYDMIEQFAPDYLDRSVQTDAQNNLWGFEYVLGSNAFIDSALVWDTLPEAIRSNPDSFQVYFDRFRENHQNGMGDGKYVPMNWNRKIYAQGKLIYKLTQSVKFSYNYIYDRVSYNDYERNFVLNPDGASAKYRLGQTHILKLDHAVSARTFYNIGFSYFTKGFKRYLYEDMYDSRYVHPDLMVQDAYSFNTGGTSLDSFERQTTTMLAKADVTSQITKTHLVKGGVEFRRHDAYQREITLRPVSEQSQIDLFWDSPYIQTRVLPDSSIYASEYDHNPYEISAYLQDKMEFNNMIVNVGLRMDYFEPDGFILNDESDPSIYNPIRPENRYHDWGTDGVPDTRDSDGTEGNGLWDTGEPAVTLTERESIWYKKASAKIQLSPRIGVSFPITDTGVIHFSYGHFFQIPSFERLYQNPDFQLGSGTGNVGVIGNADLKPEQTISGEIGLQQQVSDGISLNMTGFFRDIRNLIGTRADEIVIFGGSAKYSKFTNSDFGFIRGIILALTFRYSGFTANLDYTYQICKGTNSNPEQARNALAGGSLPEVQLTSLDWDQTHTVNLSLSYNGRGWGTSLIGQFGSGLPYTPLASQDITTLLTNSQRKPSTFNVDLRAFKDFTLGPTKLTLFLRIFNLLDMMNEINVWNDTGRAGFTTYQETAEATHPLELVNSLDTWYTNPTYYSEPRRIELGFSFEI